MLKYKYNIRNIENEYQEIEYKEIYLSLDGSFISGVTSPSYGLSNKQSVFMENISDKGWEEYGIVAQDKIRCGFVKFHKKFYIQNDVNTQKKYIRYIDGKAYSIETLKNV